MTSQLSSPHKIRLWGAIALSVGLMAPTMAMSFNGVGVSGLVGKSVPLVFVIGFVGVLLVAYGFVRLTRYFNHAGSVYALVGVTVGPRAGFFGGFALIGTYLCFNVASTAASGVLANAFLAEIGVSNPVSWLLIALVFNVAVLALCVRESRVTARALMTVEIIGVLAMVVLCVVIFFRVGSGYAPQGQHIDFTAFTPAGNSVSTLMTATVFAFLSWAGFEACAAMGEETDNPRRNIPAALMGALAITGVLFVFVMFAQTVGFGTNAEGVESFSSTSESSLVYLSHIFVNPLYAAIFAFATAITALGSVLGSTVAGSRLIFALARDGFGPKPLARVHERSGAPVVAVCAVTTTTLLVLLVFRLIDAAPFDIYYWVATVGVLGLLVVYALAAMGVIVFTLRGRGSIPKWEVVIPSLAVAFLLFVFYKQSVGQPAPYNSFPFISGAWCLLGFIVVLVAPNLARRIGRQLAAELAATGSDVEMTTKSDPNNREMSTR